LVDRVLSMPQFFLRGQQSMQVQVWVPPQYL
jgi:hypothetical protein